MLAVALLGGAPAGSSSAENDAKPRSTPSVETAQFLVQNTTARVLAAMSQEREEKKLAPGEAYDIVSRIVMPSVDLESTSRLVLGSHWSSATDAQRRRFMQVFGDQLIRTYVLGIADYLSVSNRLAIQIDYLPGTISNNGKVAVVRSRVGASSMSVDIDYRLRLVDGSWRVFDVIVEGVSVASTYRSSFMSEARRNGMDRLIERIAEKNRKLGPV